MLGIIQSELLKMRHTFTMKLVIMAPLVTLLLSYLLNGSYVQLLAYNWWYFIILPLVVLLWSANMIVREKNTGMQNIVCLPVQFDQIWVGKIVVLVILLFVTNFLLWIAATAVGFVTTVTVSPLNGLIGCMLLFLSNLWQIPFIMLLANFIGYIPTVLVSLAANITLSAIVTEKDWFLFVPYAIPARIVCPFFKMHVNGILLESDSPLLEGGCVLPALIISLAYAFVIFLVSTKLFSRGRTHE